MVLSIISIIGVFCPEIVQRMTMQLMSRIIEQNLRIARAAPRRFHDRSSDLNTLQKTQVRFWVQIGSFHLQLQGLYEI